MLTRFVLGVCLVAIVACAEDAPMQGTNQPKVEVTYSTNTGNGANQTGTQIVPAAVITGPTVDINAPQNAAKQQVNVDSVAGLISAGLNAAKSGGGSSNSGSGTSTNSNVGTQATVVTHTGNGGVIAAPVRSFSAISLCERAWTVPNSTKIMCNGSGYRDEGQSKGDFVRENYQNYAAGLCKSETLGSAPMNSYNQSCSPVSACVSCVTACIQAHVAKFGPFNDSMCDY